MPKSTRDSWNRFSFTALESNRSYWCLDFTFSAFRIVRQYKFLLFKPPYLWCLVFASPGYEYSCVCVFVCVCVCARAHSITFDSLTLCSPMDNDAPGFSVHEIFLARITGVGCHFLLQGSFLIQRSNPGLLHCR